MLTPVSAGPGYARRHREHPQAPETWHLSGRGTMRLLSAGSAVSTAVTAARPQPGSHLRPPLALVTALAGGLALAAAFPPAGFWPLAVIGPALLTVALWQQRARVALAASFVF